MNCITTAATMFRGNAPSTARPTSPGSLGLAVSNALYNIDSEGRARRSRYHRGIIRHRYISRQYRRHLHGDSRRSQSRITRRRHPDWATTSPLRSHCRRAVISFNRITISFPSPQATRSSRRGVLGKRRDVCCGEEALGGRCSVGIYATSKHIKVRPPYFYHWLLLLIQNYRPNMASLATTW